MAEVKPVIWIIEDDARTRKATKAALAAFTSTRIVLGTQEAVTSAIASLSADTVPAVVVLDLHLPWNDKTSLPTQLGAGGVGCLELLRRTDSTSDVPVIVFSAFAGDDDVLRSHLKDLQPLTFVDKPDYPRLREAVASLIPNSRFTLQARLFGGQARPRRIVVGFVSLVGLAASVLGIVQFFHPSGG